MCLGGCYILTFCSKIQSSWQDGAYGRFILIQPICLGVLLAILEKTHIISSAFADDEGKENLGIGTVAAGKSFKKGVGVGRSNVLVVDRMIELVIYRSTDRIIVVQFSYLLIVGILFT